MIEVRISQQLKAKCAKAALGWVRAEVETSATPGGLDQALRACEERIAKLADPRAILEAPAILATRAGYKALGKDPARYRGSAEALLRRVIAGKGLPRINSVVDAINLVSVESRLPIGLYDLAHARKLDILQLAKRLKGGRERCCFATAAFDAHGKNHCKFAEHESGIFYKHGIR